MMKKKNLLAQAITLSLLLSVPVGSAWAVNYIPDSTIRHNDSVDLEYSLNSNSDYNPIKTTDMMGISSTSDSYDTYRNKMVNDLTITAGDTIKYSTIRPSSNNPFLSNIKGNFSIINNSNNNALHIWSDTKDRADLVIHANSISITSNAIAINAVNQVEGENVVKAELYAKNNIVLSSTNDSAVYAGRNNPASKGAEIVLSAGNKIELFSDSQNAVSVGTASSVEINAAEEVKISGGNRSISNSGSLKINQNDTKKASHVLLSGAVVNYDNAELLIDSGEIQIKANKDTTSFLENRGDMKLNTAEGGISITTQKDDGSYYSGNAVYNNGSEALLELNSQGNIDIKGGSKSFVNTGSVKINQAEDLDKSSSELILLNMLDNRGEFIADAKSISINSNRDNYSLLSNSDNGSMTLNAVAGDIVINTADIQGGYYNGIGIYNYAEDGSVKLNSSAGDVLIKVGASSAINNYGNIEIYAKGTEIFSNNSTGIVNNSDAKLTIKNDDTLKLTNRVVNYGQIDAEAESIELRANQDLTSTLWTDGKHYQTNAIGSSNLKATQGDIVITTKKDDGSYYTGQGIVTSGNTNIEAAGKVIVDVYERGIASSGGDLNIQAQELEVTAGTHAINVYSSGTVTVDAPIVNLNAINGVDKTYGDYELAINVSTGSKVDFLNAETISIDGGISAKGADDSGRVSEVNIEAKDAITIKGTIKNVGETANPNNVTAGGIININQAEGSKAVVNIESDIYRGQYPYAINGEATVENGSININLNNEQSSLNGNVYDTNDYENNSDGVHLGLAGGAVWNTDGNSTVKEIASDGGKIHFTGSSEQKVYFDTLSGNDTTITLNHIGAEKLIVANDNAVNTHLIADESASEEANGDLEAVVQSTNMKSVTDVTAQESSVYGEMSAKVENNHVVRSSVVEKVNIANQGISEMASISLMAWRQENNDMNKRLGELRDSSGEHGVWMRMTRGEAKYGAQNIRNQYNSYQLGYDEKLSVDKSWTVGAALTYTDAESSFTKGKGENKHKGFAVYGSKLNKDGSFIDLIAKYARLEHEFEVAGGAGKGDYDTNGYSVSAEYGKRFTKANGLWIEPQAELTYGRLGSAGYTTNQGVLVRQDGMDSVVARLGFAAGKSFKQGNAYVRASYLYDFAGETDVIFSKNGAVRSFEQDLGSSWWEVGIGANINFSKSAHFYLDIEKTYGGNVATPWQWNAGLRWSF